MYFTEKTPLATKDKSLICYTTENKKIMLSYTESSKLLSRIIFLFRQGEAIVHFLKCWVTVSSSMLYSGPKIIFWYHFLLLGQRQLSSHSYFKRMTLITVPGKHILSKPETVLIYSRLRQHPTEHLSIWKSSLGSFKSFWVHIVAELLPDKTFPTWKCLGNFIYLISIHSP